MENVSYTGNIQFWPVIMGWIIVCCMYLFKWKRPAMIATAGMTLVTLMVVAASRL